MFCRACACHHVWVGVHRHLLTVTHCPAQPAQIQCALDKPLLEAFGFGVSEANLKLAGAPACEVRKRCQEQTLACPGLPPLRAHTET